MTSYIESAAGVEAGGRTGLTVIVTGCLFLLSLFLTPLILIIPGLATAPALVIVGAFMMVDLVHIRFDDFTEALPAFLTIIMMPLTYSIAQGLAGAAPEDVEAGLAGISRRSESLLRFMAA